MNEVNYKVEFANKYFKKGNCEYDVLKEVDILLKDKKNNYILYIESKYIISNQEDLKKALAQTILTNKKQKHILSKVALIYKSKQNDTTNDTMVLIDCSDDSIMYNNDINWKAEKPSNPTYDAIARIYDRIQNKITTYTNQEIKEVADLLLSNQNIKINITLNNINTIYNEWKNSVEFKDKIKNEQEIINLFLVDCLNGTQYKQQVIDPITKTEQPLIREGTYLYKYTIEKTNDKIRIIYDDKLIYNITNVLEYDNFWKKYQRPPQQQEFLNILERSATLYSDKYRRDTGGEYTPSSFVEKQNQILKQNGYNLNDYIIVDTCAGVGNLENEFGMEIKQNCYLSTLEENDVEICKIKGFENTIKYDYLKDNQQPTWKYQGEEKTIQEILKLENKKLMVIINPPYQRKKGFKNNLAIEFFNKILQLNPQVIIFYYQTESFLRDEIEHYIKSDYKIVSHIMSNAKTTFKLSNWPISQVIFDKDKGEEINKDKIKIDRYEVNPKTERLEFIKTYVYSIIKPSLTTEIENAIKKHKSGLILGNYSYMSDTINLTNKTAKNNNKITTNNLKYALLSKGINFNTHNQYFERNQHVYRGDIKDITEELFNDAIMFSLFYKNCAFTNKGIKNYIMPFTSTELGCNKNDLNVLRGENDLATDQPIPPFDFRQWLQQFNFSKQAQDLYNSALQIFLYYHKRYPNTDYNDSFYDITNTIMGKDISQFKILDTENDTRIEKTKTTKGSKGFGKNTIKSVVESKDLPIFYNFFATRDVLAKKINQQLVDSGLLLWHRENIY